MVILHWIMDMNEIMEILEDVEIIAHDKTIDFDSAKHILDDEKMNKVLKLIRKFYVYVVQDLKLKKLLKCWKLMIWIQI